MTDNSINKSRVDEIDKVVANNLRTRRLLKGLSQSELGDAIGVSIQQIQKYEKGINRISSSRLFHFAKLLEVPLSYLFHSLDTDIEVSSENLDNRTIDDETSDRDLLALIKSFNNIEDPLIRRRILELLKCLAEDKDLDLNE